MMINAAIEAPIAGEEVYDADSMVEALRDLLNVASHNGVIAVKVTDGNGDEFTDAELRKVEGADGSTEFVIVLSAA